MRRLAVDLVGAPEPDQANAQDPVGSEAEARARPLRPTGKYATAQVDPARVTRGPVEHVRVHTRESRTAGETPLHRAQALPPSDPVVREHRLERIEPSRLRRDHHVKDHPPGARLDDLARILDARYHVDRARYDAVDHSLDVAHSTQRRLHLIVAVVVSNIGVGDREMVRRGLAGHRKA